MKKRSLIFGIAVFVCSALIFSGCEQEASTETVTVNNGAAADLTALKTLLVTPGVNTVDYYGELVINNESLVIPAGKTVTVKDGGVTITGTSILGVVGTLTLPLGKEIVVTGSNSAVAGSQGVLDLVSASSTSATKALLYNSLAAATAAFDAASDPVSNAALVNVNGAELTATAVKTTKNLIVLGDVTIGTTPPATVGNVYALGRLVFGATADISSYPATFIYTNATLKNTAAVTVTLPADTSSSPIAAIDASTAAFTIAGAGTALTVEKIYGNVVLPASLTDVTISGGSGNITAPAIAIAGDAEFSNGGTVTFDDVTLTATKSITLDGPSAVTLKTAKSIKVGSDPVLTAGATDVALTPASGAKLTAASKAVTLSDGNLTITSGALTVAADATLTVTTVDLNIDPEASLVLARTDTATATITGSIVAGATEITGIWTVGGAAAGTVTILGAEAGATITSSAATAAFTAGTGGTITQNAGADNNLTIAADTTIALGGSATKAGEIVLKDTAETSTTTNGKLTLIGTITTGNTAGTNQASGAPLSADGTTEVSSSTAYTKIGVENLAGDGSNAKVAATNDPTNGTTSAAGKIAKLTGAASGATITGGDDTATDTNHGTISGATATVADSTA
jgi:hypothetical protein